jgi:hypothetical protein
MKQRLIENLGFIYIAVGFFALMIGLVFLPIPPSTPLQPSVKAKVHTIKVAPFTLREQVLVAAYRNGWTGGQWTCLRKLITLENRAWSPQLKNAHSTASGIFQVIKSPSGVMFNEYTVAQQAKLGMKYIKARYGNPCVALSFHYRKGWY